MSALDAAHRRKLVTLCAVSAAWAVSFGLGAPLASLWLADHGCEPTVLGLNTAAYYAGIALTALFLPRWMGRSARGCVVTGMLLSTLTTALFPAVNDLAWWFLLRAVGGAGTALCLIPLETFVNHNAAPQTRAREFGYYASAVAAGIGLGTVVGLPLYPLAPRLAFALGGLCPLVAAGPAWRLLPAGGLVEESSAGTAALSLRRNSLGFGTAWAQGFLEGGMVTFLSVYLLGLGHSEAAAGVLMGVLFLGVIAFQVPVAWLADRGGRLRVLLGCHALAFAGLLLLPWFAGVTTLGVLLFVVGGSCAALYPLGLSLLGERLPPAALGRANAWYLACNCGGSLTGPVVMGLAVRFGGGPALFVAGACSIALVLVVWIAGRQATPELVQQRIEPSERSRAA
jgi:MFS family permease